MLKVKVPAPYNLPDIPISEPLYTSGILYSEHARSSEVNTTPIKKRIRQGAIVLWAAPAFLLGRERGIREAERGRGSAMLGETSGSNGNTSPTMNTKATMPWERGGEECLEPLLHLLRLQEDMSVIALHFSNDGVEREDLHAIADAAFSLGEHSTTERVIASYHAEVSGELCREVHAMATGLGEINATAGLRVRGQRLHGGDDMRYSRELAHAYRVCLEKRVEEMDRLRGELRRILEKGHATAVENLNSHLERGDEAASKDSPSPARGAMIQSDSSSCYG